MTARGALSTTALLAGCVSALDIGGDLHCDGGVPCPVADGGSRACVALATDPRNCGACGALCAPQESCSAGRCVPWTCAPGSTRCVSAESQSLCASDGLSSLEQPCAAGESCLSFRCAPAPGVWPAAWQPVLQETPRPQPAGAWLVNHGACGTDTVRTAGGGVVLELASDWNRLVRTPAPESGALAYQLDFQVLDASTELHFAFQAQAHTDQVFDTSGYSAVWGGGTLYLSLGGVFPGTPFAVSTGAHSLRLELDASGLRARWKLDGTALVEFASLGANQRGPDVTLLALGRCGALVQLSSFQLERGTL